MCVTGNSVIFETVLQNYKKYKKQYEKDQQIIESFDKLYRKSRQDNVIDKSEYECFCNNFTKNLDDTRIESFF